MHTIVTLNLLLYVIVMLSVISSMLNAIIYFNDKFTAKLNQKVKLVHHI